uniref:Uncharacterized protein n=1 Tax=Oryza sativa subsp. japonica TaxID=39947 RepID=Q10P32_ORYSJ|nr:hypothetical protein LOC_Os03g14480 [Oryza sativa Japonica Group]
MEDSPEVGRGGSVVAAPGSVEAAGSVAAAAGSAKEEFAAAAPGSVEGVADERNVIFVNNIIITLSDEEVTKRKVVDLDERINFVVDHIPM